MGDYSAFIGLGLGGLAIGWGISQYPIYPDAQPFGLWIGLAAVISLAFGLFMESQSR